MSDLISRKALMQEINDAEPINLGWITDIIMKAKAIEQGEVVGVVKPQIANDGKSGHIIWFKSPASFLEDALVYLSPQQHQEQGELVRKAVADALEEAVRLCDEEAAEWNSDDVITNKNYAEVCSRRIRALIKRNAEVVE